MLNNARSLGDENILQAPRFYTGAVLDEAIKTRYYFDIKSLITTMFYEGEIKEDGSFNTASLRERARGRDCYDAVCCILDGGE